MIAALFLARPGFAPAQGAVELPQTGQKQCYDASGAVIDCATLGQTQDGAVQAGADWPVPRFTDNADGTVTDDLTGLMWLKDGNCFGTRNWTGALDTVDDFNTTPTNYDCYEYDEFNPPHSDWRLPNIVELDSLVHAGYNEEDCGGPCGGVFSWLNTQGFDDVRNDDYWSGTSRANQTNYAMIVYMGSSYVGSTSKISANYVWPVRAGQ